MYQFKSKNCLHTFLITLHILLIFHLTQRGIVLITSHFATSKSQRFIKHARAKIWNNIPTNIKNKSFIKFKERYKKLLLNKYIVE